MTMRDTRADAAYFADVIAVLTANIESDDRRVARPVEDFRSPMLLGMASLNATLEHWRLFGSEYSAGATTERLVEILGGALAAEERALTITAETLDAAQREKQYGRGASLATYRRQLWLVSLGVSLKVDDAVFDRIVEAVRPAWGDRLLDRLIASRRSGHPVGAASSFPKITGLLEDAVTASEPGAVASYLAKWYGLWAKTWGWGGHEFLSKKHYWGYWAFEAVGVVVAAGIDDASFRDQEYYPADAIAP